VSLGDVRVTGESVRHRASLVYTRADFLDSHLEIANALGVVLDGIQLLASRIRLERGIFLGGLAGRARWRELLRVLEVLGEDLLELADRVVMLGNEIGKILDVSCDGSTSKGRVRSDAINDASNALVGAALLGEVK
jgi:hypothetical protein